MDPLNLHDYFEATGPKIDASIPALSLLQNKMRNGGRFFLLSATDRVPNDAIVDVIRQDAKEIGITIKPGSMMDCYEMEAADEHVANLVITNWSEKEGKATNQGVRITITAE